MSSTVFISSTIDDLRATRKSIAALLRQYDLRATTWEEGGVPAIGKADLASAASERAAQADLVLLLVGHRYGKPTRPGNRTPTEEEYEAAKDAGVPILAYIPESYDWVRKSRSMSEVKSDPIARFCLQLFTDRRMPKNVVYSYGSEEQIITNLRTMMHGIIADHIADIRRSGQWKPWIENARKLHVEDVKELEALKSNGLIRHILAYLEDHGCKIDLNEVASALLNSRELVSFLGRIQSITGTRPYVDRAAWPMAAQEYRHALSSLGVSAPV